MRCLRFMWLGLMAAMLAIGLTRAPQACAQTPRLSLESAGETVTRLHAAFAGDGPLHLEGSFDLEFWFPLGSQAPVAGSARFEHVQELAAEAVYYRVRAGSPGAAGWRLTAVTDPSISVATLLTPEEGAGLELIDARGVRYEFTAPRNAVREPVVIRMTAVTNVMGFPEVPSALAVVRFEPDGLRFLERGALRITFPWAVSAADWDAWSVDADGGGFHLLEWDVAGQTAVLSVDGFSAKGVGRFASGAPTFDRAWEGSRDARYAAEDRGARRRQAIARDELAGKITEAESVVREKASRLRTLEDIYRHAVKPYEAAAARNCAIGRGVVLFDLEKLCRDWSRETGLPKSQSPFWEAMQRLAVQVRCRCAQALIDRCEKEPGVSGSALLEGMIGLLSDIEEITRRTDAQGCAVGSDAEILARLESGPCFGDWEGTVKLTRTITVAGQMVEGIRTRTWDDERHEVYRGTVQRIASERTFTVGGRHVQSWNLETAGKYLMAEMLDQHIKQDSPDSDVIQHTRIRRFDAEPVRGVGTLFLRLEDGAFASLGVDGGAAPEVPGRHMGFTQRTKIEYECKETYPKDRECPAGSTSSSQGTIGLYLGISVDTGTVPPPVAEVGPRSLTVRWTRSVTNESAFRPPQVETRKVEVDLVRKE